MPVTPTNIGAAYISLELDDTKLRQGIASVKQKLEQGSTAQTGFISKQYVREFNAIAGAAKQVGGQISTALKIVSAPITAGLGKAVSSLFASKSQAGEEARIKWERLNSKIQEGMTRIGYYVMQSKIFGKDMWGWIEKFSTMLQKVTRDDVQKLVNLLKDAAIAMGAIYTASKGIDLAKTGIKVASMFGGGTGSTTANVVSNLAGGALSGAGGFAGARFNTAGLNIRTALSGIKGPGYSGVYSQDFLPADYSRVLEPGKKIAAIDPKLATVVQRMNDKLAMPITTTSIVKWGAAVLLVIASVTTTMGMIANRMIKGNWNSSMAESTNTGMLAIKSFFKSIFAFVEEFGAIIGQGSAFTNEADMKKLTDRRRQDMWSWIGGGENLDPTVWLKRSERRNIDRTNLENEPSFQNLTIEKRIRQLKLIENMESVNTGFGEATTNFRKKNNMPTKITSDIGNIADDTVISVNKQINIWKKELEASKRFVSELEPLLKRKQELEKNELRRKEDFNEKFDELTARMGMRGAGQKAVIAKAKAVIAKAKELDDKRKENIGKLGYTGQTVGYTDVGKFVTNIQVDMMKQQVEAAKGIMKQQVEAAKGIMEITKENNRVTEDNTATMIDLKETIKKFNDLESLLYQENF